MSESANNVFRVGDWLVEADLNRLSRDGESLLVEPKAMDVLVYLCRRPGEVVSADELIDAIWQGRPMGDNPVYKSVAKLRRALGDDAGRPRYIATVAKKGYRLLAGVAVGHRGRRTQEITTQVCYPDAPVFACRGSHVVWCCTCSRSVLATRASVTHITVGIRL